jgi:hypothetical protein
MAGISTCPFRAGCCGFAGPFPPPLSIKQVFPYSVVDTFITLLVGKLSSKKIYNV